PIIRNVKARSFENQPGAGSNLPFHAALAPGFLPAGLLGARFQCRVLHGLGEFERFLALLTVVNVGRHQGRSSSGEKSGDAIPDRSACRNRLFPAGRQGPASLPRSRSRPRSDMIWIKARPGAFEDENDDEDEAPSIPT